MFRPALPAHSHHTITDTTSVTRCISSHQCRYFTQHPSPLHSTHLHTAQLTADVQTNCCHEAMHYTRKIPAEQAGCIGGTKYTSSHHTHPPGLQHCSSNSCRPPDQLIHSFTRWVCPNDDTVNQACITQYPFCLCIDITHYSTASLGCPSKLDHATGNPANP